MGQATARNTGLDHATGDYVSFVDSDDYIDKNFILVPNLSYSVRQGEFYEHA